MVNKNPYKANRYDELGGSMRQYDKPKQQTCNQQVPSSTLGGGTN